MHKCTDALRTTQKLTHPSRILDDDTNQLAMTKFEAFKKLYVQR